jgi:protocatechuate 3,4-dioxygenase beta subunit
MAASILTRRGFLHGITLASAAYFVPGVFAEELVRTPDQTEGPFYPSKLPLDTDNDLLIINDSITPAVGKITHLTGKILDARGQPLRNALVEIWQVDNSGAYLHERSSNREKRDRNFQGFGRFLTGLNGEYYFRTVKPVAYPGRTPHIHFKVKKGDKDLLNTQCYIKGEAGNERDFVLKAVRDEKARNSLIVDFAPLKESKIGELTYRLLIFVGFSVFF